MRHHRRERFVPESVHSGRAKVTRLMCGADGAIRDIRMAVKDPFLMTTFSAAVKGHKRGLGRLMLVERPHKCAVTLSASEFAEFGRVMQARGDRSKRTVLRRLVLLYIEETLA